MTFPAYLPFFASFICSALALLVFLQEPRSFAHRVFACGFLTLGLIEGFGGMKIHAQTLSDFFFWERLSLISESLFPGIWLLFSLSFGRSNYQDFLSKWKWPIFASFIIPIYLLFVFSRSFFKDAYAINEPIVSVVPLGWAGYLFHLGSLLVFIAILVNLEGTLRSSAGMKRWRIKFLVLGLGGLFVGEIFTTSRIVLYSAIDINETFFITYAAVVASVLITVSLIRSRLLDVDIYVSGEFFYHSLTVLGVGIYLLVVGVLARLISQFPGNKVLSLSVFFVFLSLVILALILMSDRLQQEAKRFIYRNFYRSRYDYRKQWLDFSQGTISKINLKDLCFAVTKQVSNIFGVPSVTIWAVEELQDHVILGGSTLFSEIQILNEQRFKKDLDSFISLMRNRQSHVDFNSTVDPQSERFKKEHSDFFSEARIEVCVPLFSGQQFLGVMTLGNRLTRQSFSMEDFDLLKVISDQTAGSILNLRLSQNLIKARELEAFQALSAFFIHDLKNLASTLSLTIKNLPLHYDDPEFRHDAMKVISKSVEKMNAMCSRLTLLTRKLELEKVDSDLNELVTRTVHDNKGSFVCPISMELNPIPSLLIDPNQIQKVLTNLLINASEAIDRQKGEMRIKTEQIEDKKICLSIKDNGCGISEEFIKKSLFQPFQTTKSNGLGIGLYHSKMIVEAHQGKMEVESHQGEGTTFKVILPLNQIKLS